jgi:hypothetical protein
MPIAYLLIENWLMKELNLKVPIAAQVACKTTHNIYIQTIYNK